MMYYSVSDTGIHGKKSECSFQESNPRPSDYSRFFSSILIHHSHLFTRLKMFHQIYSNVL